MSGQLLTTESTLACPHGGTVTIVSSNTKARAGGALALATDTFTITGCPFQVPVGAGTVPHPCVRVQWIATNTRAMVNKIPTLSSGSAGLCLAADQVPQGAVVISRTQAKASAD